MQLCHIGDADRRDRHGEGGPAERRCLVARAGRMIAPCRRGPSGGGPADVRHIAEAHPPGFVRNHRAVSRGAEADIAWAATRRDGADRRTGDPIKYEDLAVSQRADVDLRVIGRDGDIERVPTPGRTNRILQGLCGAGREVPHEQFAVLDVGCKQGRAVARHCQVLNVRAAHLERLHDLSTARVYGGDPPLRARGDVHTGREGMEGHSCEDRADTVRGNGILHLPTGCVDDVDSVEVG